MAEKGVAFLVGIDEYQDKNLPNFEGNSTPSQDVRRVLELLETHDSLYIPRPEFILLDQPIARKNLDEKLKGLLSPDSKFENVLVYFSGHGYQTFEGDTEEKVSKGYLGTYDAQIFLDENDKPDGQRNGLSFERLGELIKKAKHLKSLVLWLDACHSGLAIENAVLRSALSSLPLDCSYSILAAAHRSEAAYSGIFASAIVKRLKQEELGPIAADTISSYVVSKLEGQRPVDLSSKENLILLMDYPPTEQYIPSKPDPIREKGELICPYRGLNSFEDDKHQAELFFGRDRDIRKIRNRLDRKAFVPVIGISGSGKSSVVKAGLVQKQLRQAEAGQWHILEIIKPGNEPLTNLQFAFADPELRKNLQDNSPLKRFTTRALPEVADFEAILEQLRSEKQYLLVIDQFEEAFTLTPTETGAEGERESETTSRVAERDRFLELVMAVTQIENSPLKIVVTMRVDLLGKCLTHPALKDLIEEDAVYIAPLIGRGLIDAIEQPALRQGYPIAPELTEALVRDVKAEPGYLPLLEFTLEQLWRRREEGEHPGIPLSAYEHLGEDQQPRGVADAPGKKQPISGLKQALDLHANEVYEHSYRFENPPRKERSEAEKTQEQEWIRLIFLRLLRTGEDTTDTRNPQTLESLLTLVDEDRPDERRRLQKAIESLVNGRLLVSDEGRELGQAAIDLAHEALIDGWEKFREWRAKSREGRKFATQAEKDAQTWEENDKLSDYLWRGYKLAEGEKVLREYADTVKLSNLAREFLEVSSQQQLLAYLRSPDIDHLDQKALEKEAADKSFLSREKLKNLLENGGEGSLEEKEAQARLAASWLLEQWGEEMPVRMAEVDGEGKIRLRVMEEKLPTTEEEDLGNGISLELVKIPGGEFWMGSPEDEEGSTWWEKPRHEVEVSPFLIGKYPVTQAQWKAITSRTELDLKKLQPSYFQGDDRPVEQISWYEAVEFCERLSRWSQKEGKGYQYRLPSESEWEYACRAGTETPYHFGQKISPALANYIESARGRTTTVGRFQVANRFGLYDLHGNVYEWCADHWHDTYDGAPTDGSAWLSDNKNNHRLLRGGSFGNSPAFCGTAFRNKNLPDLGVFYVGLRVVASPRT